MQVFLTQRGHIFESDTDTEVIAKLVRSVNLSVCSIHFIDIQIFTFKHK